MVRPLEPRPLHSSWFKPQPTPLDHLRMLQWTPCIWGGTYKVNLVPFYNESGHVTRSLTKNLPHIRMLIRERLECETTTSSRSLVTSGFISLALLSDQIVLALDRSSERNPLECRSWREADRGRQLSLWPSPSPAVDWTTRTRLDRSYGWFVPQHTPLG